MRKNLNLVLEKLSEIMSKQSPDKLDDWWQGWEWNVKEYILVTCIVELYAKIEKIDKAIDKMVKGVQKL